MIVHGNEVFYVPATSFAISPSTNEYTLQYSVDNDKWSDYDKSVPANEVLVVGFAPKFLNYRLNGNTDDVIVQW